MSKSWKKADCPWCGKTCSQALFNPRLFYCFRIGKTVFGPPLQKENKSPNVFQEKGVCGEKPAFTKGGFSPNTGSGIETKKPQIATSEAFPKPKQLSLKFSTVNENPYQD